MIQCGSGQKFPLELPEMDELKKIVGELRKSFSISHEKGRKDAIPLLKPLFPVYAQKAFENISDEDLFKLFYTLSQLLCQEEKKEKRKKVPDDDYARDVITAAFLYKWTLEYAAKLPPELLRHCIAQAAALSPLPKEESPAPDALASAIARNFAAIRKLKDRTSASE